MASFLFLALAFGPFLAPFVIVVAAAVLAGRAYKRPPGTGWHLPRISTCVWAAVMSGSAAFGAYAWGVMSGFYFLDPDQMCAARGAQGDHVVTRATLPVSAQCVTTGGVGTELVPGWVNPVIFIGLTLLTLAVVAGAFAGVWRRLSPRW
ncbi:hypothetical protein [Streptomyces sp. TS71-3]|uniref:hypothetical protein n=1 Tax=Streptomyces sp. TS71-3 TaxID=2733862 RepID=UPI001B104D42|nr:hypothetical protein [Streptomyces sp. TS71-3]GHJ38393.1 hypothetical protein Sm713_40020 [Streptomyces sp. TS71-3]